MRSSMGSLTALRRRNRRQVLEVLRHRGTTSRAEIAKQTGLSTTTVSTLVTELLDEGVMVELADRPSRAGGGRPARMLAFNPAAGGALGVHLAHDHVRVGVTDLSGDVVAKTLTELDVDRDPARALDFAASAALGLIEEAGLEKAGIVGLGVAVSAPVAAASHAVSSRMLPNWRGVDIAHELAERTNLRVEVGNDANLGAIAEHRFGVVQDIDDFVYVMLSDGVGAGLVLGGRLYEGALGAAGELGHVNVVTDGLVCRCGNRGCLETVAGAQAIAGAMTLTHGAGTTVADVIAGEREGDQGARRVLSDAGRAVARALLPICTVLDPACAVIGGECSTSEALIHTVREELARGMSPLRANPIPVRPGALDDEAEMLGAITLATRSMTLS